MQATIASFHLNSCIQDYHIYKGIWTTESGEVNCEHKLGNRENPYAAAIKRGDSVIGHVLCDIGKI